MLDVFIFNDDRHADSSLPDGFVSPKNKPQSKPDSITTRPRLNRLGLPDKKPVVLTLQLNLYVEHPVKPF